MNKRRRHTLHGGFTLIELLTVIVIIGVLAAIALQAYASQRASAFDARAAHDLANAIRAQEAAFASDGKYLAISVVGPANVQAAPGLVVSDTVTLEMETQDTDQVFTATASSSRGSGKVYEYDSRIGIISAS